MEHSQINILSVVHLRRKIFIPNGFCGLCLGTRPSNEVVVDVDVDVGVQNGWGFVWTESSGEVGRLQIHGLAELQLHRPVEIHHFCFKSQRSRHEQTTKGPV